MPCPMQSSAIVPLLSVEAKPVEDSITHEARQRRNTLVLPFLPPELANCTKPTIAFVSAT